MSETEEPGEVLSGALVPAPPAAEMRYDDEGPGQKVARVLVRVEWADGKVREYDALEPDRFDINDPETDFVLAPMRTSVRPQGAAGFMPMNAALPRVRLSFTASPRHSMHIRTELTAEPRD